MRFIAAIVLGFALMVGTADAGDCTGRCTPVRTVVSKVVSVQPVRSVVWKNRNKSLSCSINDDPINCSSNGSSISSDKTLSRRTY